MSQRCPVCGGEVPPVAVGRPRVFCSKPCKRRRGAELERARRHERRAAATARRYEHHDPQPPLRLSPEERDETLRWLRQIPGYRELIRGRISDAAKLAEWRSQRIDQTHRSHDYLGRSAEGCG